MKFFNKIDAYFQGQLNLGEEKLFWEELESNNELQKEYDRYVSGMSLIKELGEPSPEIIEKIKNSSINVSTL